MSLLYKLVKDFDEHLRPYRYIIEFENEKIIEFDFKKIHLKHLLGIHKTRYRNFYPSLVYKKIKDKKITLKKLETDKFYSDIETRVLNFSRIKDLLNLEEGDEVIEFDSSLLNSCDLNSEYMIFNQETGESFHLGIADEDGKHYPETWFTRNRDIDRYIRNQKRIKIKRIQKILK